VAFPLTQAPIQVSDDVLDDLRRRLELTRWPDDPGNEDWYYGVNRDYLRDLAEYWRTGYDWRAAEAAINPHEHYRVEVGSVPVHFMRKPGVGPATGPGTSASRFQRACPRTSMPGSWRWTGGPPCISRRTCSRRARSRSG